MKDTRRKKSTVCHTAYQVRAVLLLFKKKQEEKISSDSFIHHSSIEVQLVFMRNKYPEVPHINR